MGKPVMVQCKKIRQMYLLLGGNDTASFSVAWQRYLLYWVAS